MVRLLSCVSMDMRIVFEEDLALAILHANLAYIDCSLDHELPQQVSQKDREPSPTPPQFPSAQIVRSTLEEDTFDPNEAGGKPNRKRAKVVVETSPKPSASKDEESVVVSLVSPLLHSLLITATDRTYLLVASQTAPGSDVTKRPFWSRRRESG